MAELLSSDTQVPRWTDHTDKTWPVEVVPAWAYDALKKDNDRLNGLINTPHTHDFIDAVRLEMPHQRERWGAEHDSGKTPADWFWLIGFLAGKALMSLTGGNIEKAKHHVITTAAALGNWFLAITGESTSMRPGIDTPKGEQHVK